MEGNFELRVPGWYQVKTVVENDFLNEKLTSDQYGIWYSVLFIGDAETFLWQTKTPPIEDEKYWGYLEKTSSGKAIKFKWDKQNAPALLPSGEPSSFTKQQEEQGEAITLSMCVKLAFQAFISAESMLPQEDVHWRQIEYMADMMHKTINKLKTSPVEPSKKPTRDWNNLHKNTEIKQGAEEAFPEEV